MKRWDEPIKLKRLTWTVIEYEDFNVVVPTTDTKAHTLDALRCSCNPRIDIEAGHMHVVHNVWEEEDAIQESMEKLFGV